MRSLSIAQTALAEIHRALNESQDSDPVMVLLEMTKPPSSFDEVKAAAILGKAPTITGERIKELETLQYWLDVVIYERRDCSPADLLDIGGVTFAMAAAVRDALAGYSLEFENNKFILRCGERKEHNLRFIINDRIAPQV